MYGNVHYKNIVQSIFMVSRYPPQPLFKKEYTIGQFNDVHEVMYMKFNDVHVSWLVCYTHVFPCSM